MTHEIFAEYIADLCARSPLARTRLYWTIIANPRAGGFTIRSRWQEHFTALRNCAAKALANPRQEGAAPSETAKKESKYGLVLTRGPGYAGSVMRALLEEAAAKLADNKGPAEPFLYLVITAGGDGTSLEVLSELYRAPEPIRACFAVLRLPMGTGNDGADARQLGDALDRLIEPAEPVLRRAVRLVTATAGKGPFPAFNILSIGLDAFVTHMTNKMKGSLPGDFYKLWVDIAALFYDRIYRVGQSDVRVLDEAGKETARFREKVLLLAVGASGHRTYGSNKRILPDDRNVCAVKQMPLFRKLALKGQFTTGTHVTQPESMLFNARRVEITPEYPVLAQMDGETVLLETRDFPLVIELTEPVIPVLRPTNTSL